MNVLFARHGRVHKSFQFSPRILKGFLVFLVIRINKVDSSQLSSIVEFGLLVFSILVLLASERL